MRVMVRSVVKFFAATHDHSLGAALAQIGGNLIGLAADYNLVRRAAGQERVFLVETEGLLRQLSFLILKSRAVLGIRHRRVIINIVDKFKYRSDARSVFHFRSQVAAGLYDLFAFRKERRGFYFLAGDYIADVG